MKATIRILTALILFSAASYGQSGEKFNVLQLRERASAPTGSTWTNGSMYFGTDQNLYIRRNGAWDNLQQVVNGSLFDGAFATNSFQILAENNASTFLRVANSSVGIPTPHIAISGGTPSNTVSIALTDNSATLFGLTSAEIDAIGPNALFPKFYADENYLQDGDETIVNAGTNITVSGTGTSGDPYVINSTAIGSGGGDVVGPASSTSNQIALFDGSTGKLLKFSGVQINSNNNSMFGLSSVSTSGNTAFFSLQPTDFDIPAIEGRFYADESENRLKYHDGTSFRALAFEDELAGSGFPDPLSAVLAEGNDANGLNISNLADGVAPSDAVNKGQLDAITVSTSGINKTANFTLSDADIQAGIINIVSDSQIICTVPSDLTVFDFVSFIVQGSGSVAFDMSAITTTGGSYQTNSGRGESATLRVYSATEADLLKPSNLVAYVPPVSDIVPSADIAELDAWIDALQYDGDSDGTAITTVVDETGTVTGIVPTNMTVNVNANGDPEFDFTASGAFINLGRPTELDYTPGTDEFTLMVVLGENAGTQGYYIAKLAPSNAQYGFYGHTGVGSDDYFTNVGDIGFDHDNTDSTFPEDEVVFLRVTTTAQELYVDGSLISSTTVGTNTENVDVLLGARRGTSSNTLTGFLGDFTTKVYGFWGKALTPTEMTNISNEIKAR
ncbi:hypothetical protein ACOKFD_15600 [Flagellimonas sp. S174]|uniref:hypothetical protein n=1 Tax=Flagellimonas sp. S174 TaxID=3410790 RepID=UPI003BF5E03C